MQNGLMLEDLAEPIHPLTGDVAPQMASALIVTIIVVVFL